MNPAIQALRAEDARAHPLTVRLDPPVITVTSSGPSSLELFGKAQADGTTVGHQWIAQEVAREDGTPFTDADSFTLSSAIGLIRKRAGSHSSEGDTTAAIELNEMADKLSRVRRKVQHRVIGGGQ